MLSGSDPAGRAPECASRISRSRSGRALLDLSRGRLAETCSVDLADDSTQRALGLRNALPHSPRRLAGTMAA